MLYKGYVFALMAHYILRQAKNNATSDIYLRTTSPNEPSSLIAICPPKPIFKNSFNIIPELQPHKWDMQVTKVTKNGATRYM